VKQWAIAQTEPETGIFFEEASEAHAVESVLKLNLTQKDLRRLRNKFSIIDKDSSGDIDKGSVAFVCVNVCVCVILNITCDFFLVAR
jgi:hypothetical protein